MALNKWATAIVCSWVIFGALATIAVGLRLWSRRIQKCRLSFNDYTIVIALVWTYGLFAVSLIYIFGSDLGDNERDVPVKDLITLSKTLTPGAVLWALANTFVKFSILHLYICLFPTPKFRLAAYAIMALTLIYIVFAAIGAFTICRPFSYLWNKSQHGHCGNQVALYLAGGIFNLILDVTVVVLPMPMLWGLQMATERKLALTGVFGLGAGICIVTVFRIKYLQDFDPQNITYSIAPEGLFTLLEPTLGILSACLPVIRPVINKLFKRSRFLSSGLAGSKSGLSTTARQSSHGQSSRNTAKRFQRLDEHAYPLKDTYGRFNDGGKAAGDIDGEVGDQDGEEQAYVSDPGDGKGVIVVENEWDGHNHVV